jgi:prophage tail gpP-like protein
LSFDDVTFQDAAKQLEERFGIKITFANEEIKKCRFTGTVEHGERLDKILTVICSFNNSTYQYNKDGSVIINGKGCNPSN